MLTCREKQNKLTSVSVTILVVIFLNVSVRLKFYNCFFLWKLWCCVGGEEKNQYGFINWFDKAEVSSISFTWSVSYRNSLQWAVYISNLVGEKIRTDNRTSDSFLKSFCRRAFLLHIVHNEACLNILDTNKRYFYIRLQSKIPCTPSIL